MRNNYIIIILSGLVLASISPLPAQNENYPVEYYKLDDSLYMYRSTILYEGNKISSNGLIIEGKDSVVVVDTPWNIEQTRQVLTWVDSVLAKPIAIFVITHAHDDRIGGIAEVHKYGISTVSGTLTQQQADKKGFEQPCQTFEQELTIKLSGIDLILYYPGAGHTVDNTVVYLPDRDLLYGGCFIKSAGAKNIGNLKDANVIAWPVSLDNLQARFPKAKTVIPGHGSYQPGAIENTRRLIHDYLSQH